MLYEYAIYIYRAENRRKKVMLSYSSKHKQYDNFYLFTRKKMTI